MRYEELAAFAAGDAEPNRQAEIREHLSDCDLCRRRLADLEAVDALLRAAAPCRPPAAAVLAARRAIASEIREPDLAEIMTLEEVAAFLRIDTDDLGEIVAELPAFELAGKVRVRRRRLIEWIRRREREYARKAAASWAANATRGGAGKGVA